MVHSIVSKFEKIWLSHTLNIIWKPKKSLFSKRKRAITVNVKYTVIKLNLYFMVHSNVWKFEKIWLSSTLIIIRKPKVWRTDGRTYRHEDPYIPQSSKLRLWNLLARKLQNWNIYIDSIDKIWQKLLVQINFHGAWDTRPLLKSMTDTPNSRRVGV